MANTSYNGVPLSQIEREIKDIEDSLKEMKKTESHLVNSIEVLHKRAEEQSITEEMLRIHRLEMQIENLEAEYKQRLSERFSYKNVGMIKKIYQENRERAAKSHSEFTPCNYNKQELKLPLYSQPSDLASYHDNIEKFKVFKPKLLLFLQKKRRAEINLDKYMRKQYQEDKDNWIKGLEKQQINPKRRQKQWKLDNFTKGSFQR